MTEMPFYTCHKRVQAAEIIGVIHLEGGGFQLALHIGDGELRVIPEDSSMVARYTPVVGDFLVRYEDGYESFSPRKAFMEGYTKDESAGNVLMEKLNQLSEFPAIEPPPWMLEEVGRIAREAYVTINSLKFQLEREKSQFKQSVSPVGWGGDHLKGTANAPKVD